MDAIVVGAGIGGLSCALRLAGAGARVLLLEAAPQVGGKMRVHRAGDQWIDAGPTVLTMLSVFEQLWSQAGRDFHQEVPTQRLEVLARHRWSDRSELDLYLDFDRSYHAIRQFSGTREADAFVRFHRKAKEILAAVQEPFMLAADNDIWKGLSRSGLSGITRLSQIQWHRSLWAMLGSYFRDPRLRQLFARYATYYGSNPFQAPGTLALIAGVELDGVWRVKGGMIELARATEKAARELGVQIECGVQVEEILHDPRGVRGVRTRDGREWLSSNVVYNGALSQLGAKLCPPARQSPPKQASLSAVTLCGLASCYGMDLEFHNVFFSSNYKQEFEDIFGKGRFTSAPTTYICAPNSEKQAAPGREQPIFALLNAPAQGDRPDFSISKDQAIEAMNRVIHPCGIKVSFQASTLTTTTPRDFETRFPGTAGALYGPATHGATGAFARPSCKSKLPGLFLVGGEVHPGAGVPMVTLGGKHCADRVIERLGLTPRLRTAAMRGGTSISSARTENTP